MIVSSEEMRQLEERAFAFGISAEALMDQAGLLVAQAVRQFFPQPGRGLVYYGKGHNGGDALVAARHLAEAGWEIEPRAVFEESNWSALTRKKRAHLGDQSASNNRYPDRTLIILDGLLGIGVAGGLREPIRTAAAEINRLRIERNAYVFAIDLPTGLNGDTGEADPGTVRADFTLTIGCCKTGLIQDYATPFVGRLAILPVPELVSPDGDTVATPHVLAGLQPRRNFDSHKTNYGRVGIVAGSMGLTGAAMLAGEAALRAGAGLVRLYVTEDIHPIVASAAAAEIMVQPVRSFHEVLETKINVLAIGPGLGRHRKQEVLDLIRTAELPVVVDADGLNILAGQLDTLGHGAGPRLLTPHPGEMGRLTAIAGRARREIVEHFVAQWPVTLLLKGARTIVGEQNHPLSYNTTGNPGMGSGGMGDVLTGVCAALIGQGRSAYDAARLGAWLCGRAAEIAVFQEGCSEESLAASDVMAHLGPAFEQLRARAF